MALIADDGTIDITDLVEAMRATFVDWADTYLWGLIVALPGVGWVAAPICKAVFGYILKWILTKLSKSAVMLAMFMNTAMRKASQAHTFAQAVDFLNNLPTTASDEDYEKAEQNKIAAFERFVPVSS